MYGAAQRELAACEQTSALYQKSQCGIASAGRFVRVAGSVDGWSATHCFRRQNIGLPESGNGTNRPPTIDTVRGVPAVGCTLTRVARCSGATKPLVRWVGGKSQMVGTLLDLIPRGASRAYHEPFVGGGSVLLGVLEAMKSDQAPFRYDRVYASDVNPHLINLYKQAQQKPEELIEQIGVLSDVFAACENVISPARTPAGYVPVTFREATFSKHNFYYWVRACFNTGLSAAAADEKQGGSCDEATKSQMAAQFLFLNNMCHGGLYREGPRGAFNVPFRKYDFASLRKPSGRLPPVCEADRIMQVSRLIQSVEFRCLDYGEALEGVVGHDMVYLDPPYFPEKATSFHNYTKDQQYNTEQLFDTCDRLEATGARFLMCNSNTTPVIDFYTASPQYRGSHVEARRSINVKNPGATTTEVIIQKLYMILRIVLRD